MTPSEEYKLYHRDHFRWCKTIAPNLLELCKAQQWRRAFVKTQALRDELNRLAELEKTK